MMSIPPIYFGFNPPFLNGSIVMAQQTDERLIKNDVLQFLMTIPGERIFRPGFGTRLRLIIFENLTPADYAALEAETANGLRNNFENIIVNNVSITDGDSDHLVNVDISLSMVANPLVSFNVSIGIQRNGAVQILR